MAESIRLLGCMNETLNITEVFQSVQGESSYVGYPTTFIRLAACNLRCTWCDTPYSFGKGTSESLETIVAQVEENGCRFVCITGGEPLLQKGVHLLMNRLVEKKYRVSLETGGSLPIQDVHPGIKIILDVKCPGSGMSHKNDITNFKFLKAKDEVKFVILDRNDYTYAKQICTDYPSPAEVLFSPVFDRLEPQTLVEWILEDKLNVRLNLQMHKFIWDPETRGV